MIVTSLEKIQGSPRDVAWGQGQSRRFLLEQDNMGFAFTDTTIERGAVITLQYKQHLEACYILEGAGQLLNEETGERHDLRPGVFFALDKHDRHSVEATEGLRMVCVFNPPLKGDERHSLKEGDASSY